MFGSVTSDTAEMRDEKRWLKRKKMGKVAERKALSPMLQPSELISYNPSHVFDKSFMVPFSLLKRLLEIFIN